MEIQIHYCKLKSIFNNGSILSFKNIITFKMDRSYPCHTANKVTIISEFNKITKNLRINSGRNQMEKKNRLSCQ